MKKIVSNFQILFFEKAQSVEKCTVSLITTFLGTEDVQ